MKTIECEAIIYERGQTEIMLKEKQGAFCWFRAGQPVSPVFRDRQSALQFPEYAPFQTREERDAPTQ
jgi:hypothetical protein